MDMLSLLAEASQQPLITESFLKWVVGGMSIAIVGLAAYIKALNSERKDYLQKQIDEAPSKRNEIEGALRGRYQAVIDKKDEEIEKLEADIKDLHIERLQFLQLQIEDAKKQEKGLEELTEDYNNLIQGLKPLIQNNVEVLDYYRQRRERAKK